MYTIPQSYVGSITEHGEAFCFGAAFDDKKVVYLDIAGPTETVKSIRAKLVSKGRVCWLNPVEGDSLVLSPGGKMQHDVLQRKVAYGLVHAIFAHKSIAQPLYAELSTTYLMFADKQQATARLGEHIHRLLKIPVRTDWYPFLVQQGRFAGLVQRCDCHGGVQLHRVTLDETRWQSVIQTGLTDGKIHLMKGAYG
jgi:hypothetical protein